MNRLTVVMSLVAVAAAAHGANLRRLPAIVVSEGASVEFATEAAVGLKSSNSALASVTPPDGGRATVSGVRLGGVEIVYSDVKGPYAVRPVSVVPAYWQTLLEFFEDDPEVTVSVSGDKVIIGGKTANPDTLRHVEQAKLFDVNRIISQVTYSTASIGQLVGQYLAQIGYSNVTVNVIGNEVCLSGRLFDQPTIKLVGDRAKTFLRDFPGIGLNTDGLKIYKQKIVIDVEMLKYDVREARNLGIKWPTAISATGSFGYGWDASRTATENVSKSHSTQFDGTTTTGYSTDQGQKTSNDSQTLTTTLNNMLSGGGDTTRENSWRLNSSVAINDISVTVNMLKQNGVAKTLYKTSLATQSGEEAQFQNGGTIHRNTQGTFSNGDVKEIEYGFMIKAKPLIIDAQTVNLDLDLDNRSLPANYSANTSGDINLQRYQTKSKYMVRPGETIVLSGFNQVDESQTKDGVPFLSHIPLIGPWLFGNTGTSNNTTEMLLVVKIDWALENAAEEAVRLRDEFRARKAEVEMP